jgi:hypothetical protein
MQLEGALADRFFMTSRQVAEMTATIAQEMVDFAGRRMRAQLDFMGSLPNCSEPQDVMAAQFRFVADASKDYADEISHMSQVLRRMNDEALSAGPRAA